MRVAVTGSSGLIGTALIAALEGDGHQVTRLVRGEAHGPNEVRWSPSAGTIDAAGLEGHAAVVHLAGVGIGDRRWTAEHKAAVLDSRVQGTSLLASTLAGLDRPPPVLATASAVGYYGDRGAEPLTETDGPGTGFLADVVRQWEDAAAPAAAAGIRVARLRSGVVLTDKGGALDKQLLAFKMGAGGRIGSGEQYLSWISLDDEVSAIRHVLDTATLTGPVNLTAPNPVTNAEFTKALGTVLGRPTVLPVPKFALHAMFGKEMVAEMLLAGQRVLPAVLQASGFAFCDVEIEAALRRILGK
ncbi:MAG TPA: TIGR01777 family oxidoreductase [Acidimicrobiales bacterium]|nr:TIGR01777 family oxidoreductase [Acidimicrobiales bacterium]